ncbi:MAG: O-methyltransferase [Nanoarchaeota archaeon]
MNNLILKKLDFLDKNQDNNENNFNITWSQGVFIEYLVNIKKPKNILEIGCGNGFSTLWIAKGLLNYNFNIDTIDINSQKIEAAKKNTKYCKINDKVNFYIGDVFEVLLKLQNKSYDFIFIDSCQKDYTKILEELKRLELFDEDVTIVFDNIFSHKMNYFVSEMNKSYFCETINIGGGFLVLKIN